MIGDMISDMEAGRNAGCRGTILVRTGLGGDLDAGDPAIDFVADDLGAAARLILDAAGSSMNGRRASFESS
jgi:D-glycero-D-manno-heptose 1,7-bisphosphate phosphatase